MDDGYSSHYHTLTRTHQKPPNHIRVRIQKKAIDLRRRWDPFHEFPASPFKPSSSCGFSSFSIHYFHRFLLQVLFLNFTAGEGPGLVPLVSSFLSVGVWSISIVWIWCTIEGRQEGNCKHLLTIRNCLLHGLRSFRLSPKPWERSGSRNSWWNQQLGCLSCLGTFSDTYFLNMHRPFEHILCCFVTGWL